MNAPKIGDFLLVFIKIGRENKSDFLVRSLAEGRWLCGEIILKSLKAIDSVLLGVMFFIMGLGLFELFIKPIDNLPDWFQMENIDQLKAMLVKLTIVVMGVSFTGKIVSWNGTTDLLNFGVGLGAFALSYFLHVKNREGKLEKK